MRNTRGQNEEASVRLMKPGPAISTLSICGSEASSGAMRSASARGPRPACFASTMAALVARSPCEASFGDPSVMPSMLAPGGTTPSCFNCWTAARTRPWNPAKTSMEAPEDYGARLTQIGRGVKQAAMLGKRKAIGHSGDEIGDVAGIGAAALRRRSVAPIGRKGVGRGAVALEQVAYHARGVGHDADDALVPVDAGEEEGAQDIEVAAQLVREGDDGMRRMTDLGGASRPTRLKPSPALCRCVFDHRADEAADGFVEEPRTVDAGIGFAHAGERTRRDRHFGKLGEGEESGAVAVVDVVIVIGDVIGERRGLRLDRGEGRKLEVLPCAVFADRLGHGAAFKRVRPGQRTVMLDQTFERLPGEVEAVEARIFLFQQGDHAQRLGIVVEAARVFERRIERAFAGMAEGWMAEIVGKRKRLGQILVGVEVAGKGAGDLRHFERVGQARTVVIAFVIDKDLGLVVEPAEGRRVKDAVAIARVRRACGTRRLKQKPPAACGWIDGVRGKPARAALPAIPWRCRKLASGLTFVVD